MSRFANASAAALYSPALFVSPFLSASAAIRSAWRALPLTRPSSSSARLRRSSVCFWFAITFAACSRRRRCCSCASCIACSSCTFGSARSLNRPVSFAVRYAHCRLRYLIMRRSLSAPQSTAEGDDLGHAEQQQATDVGRDADDDTDERTRERPRAVVGSDERRQTPHEAAHDERDGDRSGDADREVAQAQPSRDPR